MSLPFAAGDTIAYRPVSETLDRAQRALAQLEQDRDAALAGDDPAALEAAAAVKAQQAMVR